MWKSYVVAALCGLGIAACATTTPSVSTQSSLEAQSSNTIAQMEARQPALRSVLQTSNAYAVFPSIGKAAFIGGGAYRKCILYEGGRATGFVELKQASFGFQAGGQTFAELIVLPDSGAINKLKSGNFKLGADAAVVILNAGAQGAGLVGTESVFVMPHGGLMAGISVTGQSVGYAPLAG
jgi:lipid-binding SYLF domain-containing protein